MTSATITSKGQVTIPKEIRDYLKLETGTKVDFVIDENGQVKMIPLNVDVSKLSAILHRPGMKSHPRGNGTIYRSWCWRS